MANNQYLELMQDAINKNFSLQSFFETKEFIESVEATRQHFNKVYGENYFSTTLKPVVVVDRAPYAFMYEGNVNQRTTSARFNLKLMSDERPLSAVTLCTFEITMYPYCCGMRQFNGFSYNPLNNQKFAMEDLVHLMVSVCARSYFDTLTIHAKRLMVNFVEYRYGSRENLTDASEVPILEQPDMQYPAFHTWAQKQKKYRANLMYNSNSGNIIHHAEVVL